MSYVIEKNASVDALLHDDQRSLSFQTDKEFQMFNEHHVLARLPRVINMTQEEI